MYGSFLSMSSWSSKIKSLESPAWKNCGLLLLWLYLRQGWGLRGKNTFLCRKKKMEAVQLTPDWLKLMMVWNFSISLPCNTFVTDCFPQHVREDKLHHHSPPQKSQLSTHHVIEEVARTTKKKLRIGEEIPSNDDFLKAVSDLLSGDGAEELSEGAE